MVGFMAYKGIVARRAAMNGNNSTTRLDKHVHDAHDQDTNSAIVNVELSLFARPFNIGTTSRCYRYFCHVALELITLIKLLIL